jgi:hypothetical protein
MDEDEERDRGLQSAKELVKSINEKFSKVCFSLNASVQFNLFTTTFPASHGECFKNSQQKHIALEKSKQNM